VLFGEGWGIAKLRRGLSAMVIGNLLRNTLVEDVPISVEL
jgi:hypothetical protein